MSSTWIEEDAVVPTRISHQCQEMVTDKGHDAYYNFLVYEFVVDGMTYGARAYLDEIGTVSIFGPDTGASSGDDAVGPIDPRIIAYFRRRYKRIKRFTRESGYVSL